MKNIGVFNGKIKGHPGKKKPYLAIEEEETSHIPMIHIGVVDKNGENFVPLMALVDNGDERKFTRRAKAKELMKEAGFDTSFVDFDKMGMVKWD